MSYSDPFGLCPKDKGGDGKTNRLDDCPEGSEGRRQYRSGAIESAGLDDPIFMLFGGLEIRGAKATAAGLGTAIARGHAFAKHVLARGEFQGLGIRTTKQLGTLVDDIVANATGADVKSLSRGRTAFWDSSTGTVVIRDPRSPDLGTVFRPKDGRAYFDGLR